MFAFCLKSRFVIIWPAKSEQLAETCLVVVRSMLLMLPLCRTQSSHHIAMAALRDHAVIDMLSSTCKDATFALRVHIVPYPEGTICAWMMLAAKSRDPSLSRELQLL